MTLILAYKNRGITRDITIQDADGATVVPGENDLIRAVIGHEGKLGTDLTFPDAQFVVVSGSDTSAGSSFTKDTPSAGINRLRLDASDLDFSAGVYTLFLSIRDQADESEWKVIDRQIFSLENS